ncbi:MAG: BMP family lipoprotein [Bacilli bacterium]|jgi:basic membrane protein A
MKKTRLLTGVVLLAGIMLSVTGCRDKTYKLALVTDVGTINDKSFNQGAWEGMEKYAKDKKMSYQYYQPKAQTTADYVDSAKVAIENGAEVVVTPGFLFENAIWQLQTEHPDVKFILLDGSPHNVTEWDEETGEPSATIGNAEPNFDIKDNVYSIFYAEEEAGFYAGYAAVKEGFRKLGYMGGMAVPAVVRFGIGYIQGAKYAAEELELADGAVTMTYTYLGDFQPGDGHQAKAASWYGTGTEVIFAAAGGAGTSVMKAAEEKVQEGKKAWVIGVDVDQRGISETVLSSAVKGLGTSVYQTLEKIYRDGEKGGTSVILDSTVDGVGLPAKSEMDFDRFENFTKADYDAVYALVKAGTVHVDNEKEGLKEDYVAIGGAKVLVTVL